MIRWFLTLATLIAAASGSASGQSADGAAGEVVKVKGVGRGLEEAKSDARSEALKTLEARLLAHDPPLTAWQPTLADVEPYIQGPGKAGESLPIVGGVRVDTYHLDVRLPPIDEMERQNERVRRIWLAWDAFWVLLVLLGLWQAVDEIGRGWRARRAAVKS